MTDVQEFCLRWNNHQSNLVSAFHDLRLGEDFVDVTLACDGKSLQAHRIVLSACSPFFRDILKTTPCNHPVIVLKDILFRDLVALIEFMYQGEVRVLHDGLPSFFRAAEVLRVRGLTEEALLRQEASRLTFEKLAGDSAENVDASMSHSSHLADHQSEIQLRQQQTLKASTPNDGTTTRSMDDVKVEEVDLDSTSEDEMEGENTASEHKETEVGPSEETLDRDGTEKEMDELPQPSLTLQSFARIPALVSVDLNPHSSQDFNSDFSVGSDDRRPAQELQGTMELDNPLGRTPGRTSTSDRPRWPCPFCLRLLSSRSSVRRHIEDRHTNDNSRHPCPLCERLYRTRNSLQYHLSTAHRDREPGPRGRPRTRPRTESATENSHSAEAKESASETDRLFANPAMMTMYRLSRGPQFGLPPT